MKRQAYFPSRIADQLIWLENFHPKLAVHQAAVGITEAERSAAVADARFIIYVFGTWLPSVRPWALSCTQAANDLLDGASQAVMPLPVFTAPPLPAGVTPVKDGALDRIFALVATMKKAPGYTPVMGADLRIVGSEDLAPELAEVQPKLTLKITASGVEIEWNWGGNSKFLDMCELQVDRGDGKGWVLLAFDTTPGYRDSTPFPAEITRWKYRAIYHANDQQVGKWSAEESVVVGG